MTAEKICKDLIMAQKIEFNGMELNDLQKAAISKQNFMVLIDTLHKLMLIDDSTKKLLHRIREKRNAYIHVKEKMSPEKDCPVMLEDLKDVIINIHSVFNDYIIVDGLLTPKAT